MFFYFYYRCCIAIFMNKKLLLLLFVFIIYVMTVVVTVISSVSRVTTKDRRITEYSRLYIFSVFLSILTVHNNAGFCITPSLHVMPSFPIHLLNSAEKLPRAPITTGNLLIFFFRILVLFHFFFFFFHYRYISWCISINNYPLLLFFVNNY